MPCKKPVELNKRHPVVLIILDGFGISRKIKSNAIHFAKMPYFKTAFRKYPSTQLCADGECVGLPAHEVGNSEAGHQTIGAGRPILSDKLIVNRAIADGSFNRNPAFKQVVEHIKTNNSALHLMGLLTNSQSAHAALDHIIALTDLMERRKVKEVFLHLFTDGRDTPPYHGLKLLAQLESKLPKNAKIASVSGRFYAMDRNRNWNRTKLVYEALVHGKGQRAETATKAIEQAYENGITDEFIKPTLVNCNSKCTHIKANDAVIFWNLRSDRARQLTKPFVAKNFNGNKNSGFKREYKIPNLLFTTLTEFGKQLDHVTSAFTHHEQPSTLVEALRSHKQMYIAESEKYAHVTYFFNGGYDNPRFGEDRIRIPSHDVRTFDEKPEMRAKEIADAVKSSIEKGYDFICVNFANPDMVAHTGNFKATVKACEAVDKALASICKAVHQYPNSISILTADHGNAEEVHAHNGMGDTHHNANPVPFILCGASVAKKRLRRGTLADIAPTILDLMHEPIPKQMTGKSLICD